MTEEELKTLINALEIYQKRCILWNITETSWELLSKGHHKSIINNDERIILKEAKNIIKKYNASFKEKEEE